MRSAAGWLAVGVVAALDFSVAFWRDDQLRSALRNPVAQMIGIIAFVGKSSPGFEAIDEVMGKGDVVVLSGRADQSDWKAERFCRSMDLRAQAAARPTQALGIRPPFSLRAPAAC